jgi:phosphoglycerate dehydrogenase-like enzyme
VLNARILALLPRGAYIISVARGGGVDQGAISAERDA